MSYLRFGAMIATSTICMFGLMYLNTYALEHVFFSETRVYMAMLMGATMAIIMLGYMFSMYRSVALNIAILVGSAIVFALALWLVRSQVVIGQVSYMKAMIPHHSIAILTSKRADITDARVRELADEIVESQQREIAEMRYLIADLEGREGSGRQEVPTAGPPEVVPLSEALRRTEVSKLHPAPMKGGEFDKVLSSGPGCEFALVADGDPVLVMRAPAEQGSLAEGVTKLNGALVPLQSAAVGDFDVLIAGPTMQANGVRMVVRQVPGEEAESVGGRQRWKADLVFELEHGQRVGYRGFYSCDA